MPGFSTMVAVADDLTGAAEIAAIAHAHGLRTALVGSTGGTTTDTPFTVFDTDTRLIAPVDAAARLTALGHALHQDAPCFLYKKTDSVLRGNVVAETVALAKTRGLGRILLVPANPSLGRTISGGRYLVGGVPIDRTAFARDPHHPATSASVVDLLGPAPEWPVRVLALADEIPAQGIFVGEVSTPADVQAWAARMPANALPAGGAEFFTACLASRGIGRNAGTPPVAGAPALVLTGSLTPARETMLAHAAKTGWPVLPMPAALARRDAPDDVFTKWSVALRAALSGGLAVTESPRCDVGDDAASVAIRSAFARLIQTLLADGVPAHLVVEGGATAAAISDAMGWNRFHVAGAWAQGVISLRAAGSPRNPVFTIKPGSYSWPETLWQTLASQHRASR